MPAYNAAQYIHEAIESVRKQSFQDWELIVVNDGSTDGTRSYLESLRDVRIRIVNQENRGVSAARNAALELSRGEILTFLDADDALPEDSLLTRIRFLEGHPDVNIVDGRIAIKDISLSATLRERVPGSSGPYFQRLIRLDSSVFFSVAVMVRRDAVGSVRFREDLTHCEDLLFLLNASNANGWRYGSTDDTVYWYRTGNGASAMSNLDGLEDGYLKLFEACHKFSSAKSADLEYLYKRIRRILVRSWLRKGRPVRALGAWQKLRSARRVPEGMRDD